MKEDKTLESYGLNAGKCLDVRMWTCLVVDMNVDADLLVLTGVLPMTVLGIVPIRPVPNSHSVSTFALSIHSHSVHPPWMRRPVVGRRQQIPVPLPWIPGTDKDWKDTCPS